MMMLVKIKVLLKLIKVKLKSAASRRPNEGMVKLTFKKLPYLIN